MVYFRNLLMNKWYWFLPLSFLSYLLFTHSALLFTAFKMRGTKATA